MNIENMRVIVYHVFNTEAVQNDIFPIIIMTSYQMYMVNIMPVENIMPKKAMCHETWYFTDRHSQNVEIHPNTHYIVS